MKTDLPFSRRRLLARIPVVAAAAVPTAAAALPGLAAAVPDHLDVQRVRGLAEMLAKLEKLPNDEANTILKAITEVLECGMRNHAHDAELMALKPQFDDVFEHWWRQKEASKLQLDSRLPMSDEEIDRAADKLYELIDRILDHPPITRAGLALYCRAVILHGYDDWDDRTARFVGNIVLFFGWELPQSLMAGLLFRGLADGEEDGDNEDSDEA
jgi:hypothetical protein